MKKIMTKYIKNDGKIDEINVYSRDIDEFDLFENKTLNPIDSFIRYILFGDFNEFVDFLFRDDCEEIDISNNTTIIKNEGGNNGKNEY